MFIPCVVQIEEYRFSSTNIRLVDIIDLNPKEELEVNLKAKNVKVLMAIISKLQY